METMSPPGATYPPFLDELADIFEQARPNENSGAGSVTSHIQLKSTYRNVGVAGALRNVALMLSALEVGGNGDTHFTRATNILADASREGTMKSRLLLDFGSYGKKSAYGS